MVRKNWGLMFKYLTPAQRAGETPCAVAQACVGAGISETLRLLQESVEQETVLRCRGAGFSGSVPGNRQTVPGNSYTVHSISREKETSKGNLQVPASKGDSGRILVCRCLLSQGDIRRSRCVASSKALTHGTENVNVRKKLETDTEEQTCVGKNIVQGRLVNEEGKINVMAGALAATLDHEVNSRWKPYAKYGRRKRQRKPGTLMTL
ncbi:uncharacterized protein [Sagmatias obliquidens]|uniref:uncharacterized protein n=1 Tax=Sagmatias obliquidens TaxID=3371155 RepID=UPI000F4403CB|nr:uncharacterized protein LOC113622976 [Lagenorhynchus obliquidens]